MKGRSKGRSASRSKQVIDDEESEMRPNVLRVLPTKQERERLNLSSRHLKLLPTHPTPELIRFLHLSHNKLTTLIGLESYSQLESLSISHNQLQEIREFDRLANKHLLRLLRVKNNNLPYGYEKQLVAMFPQLVKLDDQQLPSTEVKIEISHLAKYVGSSFVEGYSIGLRLVDFLNTMVDQIGIKRELRQRNSAVIDNQTTRRNSSPTNLKLLHENLPQSVAIQLHKLHAQHNGRVKGLSVRQQLQLQKTILDTMVQGQLKCTCRPINYHEEMLRAFTEIFDRVLLHFSADFDRRLLKELERRASQRNSVDQQQFLVDPEYRRECLLFEFYMMAPTQSRFDNQPGKYIQKFNPLLLQNRSAVLPQNQTNLPKGQLRTVNQDLHVERLRDLPQTHPYQRRKMQPKYQDTSLRNQPTSLYSQLTDQLVVLEWTASYSEVLSKVLLQLVFRIVNIHNQILADRHAERLSLNQNSQVFEYTFDRNSVKENKEPRKELRTSPIKSLPADKPSIGINQTLVNPSPQRKLDHDSTVRREPADQPNQQRVPQLEVEQFIEPQPNASNPHGGLFVENQLTVERIHEISLMFKVLSALLMNSQQRKTLLKHR